MKRFSLILPHIFIATLLLFQYPAFCQYLDFTTTRRINVKCPIRVTDSHSSIEFNKETLSRALFLYRYIDDNVKSSTNDGGKVYTFTDDPKDTSQKHFIVHAKASFKQGELSSLSPKADIAFLDVFYVTEIDFKQNWITLKKQQDGTLFKIGIGDFERAFIWYSEMLDTDRVYIPVYGFLSIPAKASEPPDVYTSWKKERKIWLPQASNLTRFDFYRILDYKDGYYLLAENRKDNFYGHKGRKIEYGIIGWVQEKYIVLWRSRLYHRPLQEVEVYDVNNFNPPDRMTVYDKTDKINQFYLRQDYPGRQEIEKRLNSKAFVNLDRFYKNFGFPRLYPPYSTRGKYTKVTILGAFSTRLLAELVKEIKGNINAFFLVDTSLSMKPFKDFILSFKSRIDHMGFGINKSKIYAYNESIYKNKNFSFDSMNSVNNLEFGKERRRDHDYKEPLLRAFKKSLEEIRSMNLSDMQIKLLFIMTDAGANDQTPQLMGTILNSAKNQDLRVLFIIPDKHGAKKYKGMTDTPKEAHDNLRTLINGFTSATPKFFKRHTFSTAKLNRKTFDAKNKEILNKIKNQLNMLFQGGTTSGMNTGAILDFVPTNVLEMMTRGSASSDIQINNHVIKYIDTIGSSGLWEDRVLIPKNVIDIYKKTEADVDVKLEDLKKLVIVNSLVSVHSIRKCREIYRHLNKVLKLETSDNLDGVFYKGLIGERSGRGTRWKYDGLTQDMLRVYAEKRKFYLNTVKQSVQHEFIYLKLDEFVE